MKNISLKKNFVLNLIKTLMTILFPAISFPYASRILGVKNIGAVQYATSIISYFAVFAALGISIYAVREGSKLRENRKELSKFSSEILIINLITTFVSYSILFILIGLQLFDGYVILLLVCSLLILFTTLSIEWLYQIMEDYAYISFRSTIIQIVSLVLLFVFVKTKEDFVIYAFITVFSTCGYFLWNLISSKRFVDFFKAPRYDLLKHIKPILIVFGVSIAASIYLNIDVVVIGALYGNYEVGLFTVAFKINVIVKNLISSVGIVVLPRLTSYLYKNKMKEYFQTLKSGVELNLMFSIPCAVGLYCLSYETILIVSGQDYVGATVASQILAVNLVFSTLGSLLYFQVLIPNNMERKACMGTILGAAINLILNLVLVPIFSYNGAAVSTLISELFVLLLFIFLLRHKLNLRYIFQESYKFLLASLPIIPICYFVVQQGSHFILTVAVAVILSALAYFICLCLLRTKLVFEVLRDMKNLLSRRK